MTKQKVPVLSLEAHGSLGGSITYQGKGARKIARTKPRLPYFLTLPSQYQRWLYADYIAWWNNLTEAQKQVWRTAGSRRHRTGLQEFMSYNLKYLPDILGYWKLDENNHATTPDSSRHDNPGTIIGASPATGAIDGSLSFDGVNDRLDLGTPAHCRPTTALTLEIFVTPRLLDGSWDSLLSFSGEIYELYLAGNRLNTLVIPTGGPVSMFTLAVVTLGTRYHLCSTWDSSLPADNLKLYLDGVLQDEKDTTGVIDYGAQTALGLGAIPPGANWSKADIDNVLIYDRVLTPADILRHSQRRWPLE